MIRRILIVFGYLLVALFVVTVTFVLVAYGNDYTYDFATHKIVQRGHVIINSMPSGTVVTADGKRLNKKTPYQAAWSVGGHEFTLTRDGYVTWKKILEVVAGQVNMVDYAVLVPTNPQKTAMVSQSNLIAQSISRDHRHVAYVVGGAAPAVYTLELGGAKPVKVYTARAASGETPAEILTSVAWSDDASRLLIRSTVGVAAAYHLVEPDGDNLVDLTNQYRFDFSGLAFSSSSSNQLYWVSPDGLRRLDVGNQSVSAVLADRVTQFWPIAGGRILYVQQSDQGRSLWSMEAGGRRQQLIQALPQSSAYSVAYSNYRGQDELAVVPFDTGIGTLYNGIFSDTPNAKVVAHGVAAADFSPDGHMVVFSSPTTMVTYDLDRASLFGDGALHTISDQPGTLQQLTWFDNHHLLAVRDGRLHWCEYDGANRVDLGPIATGGSANRSADFRSIVQFIPDGAAGFKIESLGIR